MLCSSGCRCRVRSTAAAATAGSAVAAPTFPVTLLVVGRVDLARAGPGSAQRRPRPVTPRGAAGGTSVRLVSIGRQQHRRARRTGNEHLRPEPCHDSDHRHQRGGSRTASVRWVASERLRRSAASISNLPTKDCVRRWVRDGLVNNALAIYTKDGAQLLAPIGSARPSCSRPRRSCPTPVLLRRANEAFVLQEFVVGTVDAKGREVTPSTSSWPSAPRLIRRVPTRFTRSTPPTRTLPLPVLR